MISRRRVWEGDDVTSLGARLKYARHRSGLQQKYVAKKLGITPSALSGYEKDHREPSLEILQKLAEIYDVPLEYLVSGKTSDDKQSPPDWYDLKELLEESTLWFDGVELSERDKQRVKDVLTGLFWDSIRKEKERKSRERRGD